MKEPDDNSENRSEPPRPRDGGRRRPSAGQIVFTAIVLGSVIWALCYGLGRHLFTNGIDRRLAGKFPEPSGIVYHPSRDTLFLVGDEGDLAEMTREGRILQTGGLAEADLEGVTVDPQSGRLYALLEKANLIVEIDPEGLKPLRRFPIDTRYEGRVLVAQGADGLEGIAFVPARAHPEGGRFFIVNRGGSNSFVAELSVPLKSSGGGASAKILDVRSFDIPDLTDITWYAPAGELIVLSDLENRTFHIDPSGKAARRGRFVPGRDQEGIAFDREGSMYIAQDSGGVIKVKSE